MQTTSTLVSMFVVGLVLVFGCKNVSLAQDAEVGQEHEAGPVEAPQAPTPVHIVEQMPEDIARWKGAYQHALGKFPFEIHPDNCSRIVNTTTLPDGKITIITGGVTGCDFLPEAFRTIQTEEGQVIEREHAHGHKCSCGCPQLKPDEKPDAFLEPGCCHAWVLIACSFPDEEPSSPTTKPSEESPDITDNDGTKKPEPTTQPTTAPTTQPTDR